MKELGNKIKQIRGKESRAEFAKKHNIHPNTLQRWENGERQPDLEFLKKLVIEYDLSPEWLFLGEGEIKTPPPYSGSPRTVGAAYYADLIDNFNELRKENSTLWGKIEKLTKENGELRVEIERLKNRISEEGVAVIEK